MTRGNPLSATSSTPSRQKGGEAVFARIYGAATLGLNGHVIAVETDISNVGERGQRAGPGSRQEQRL